MKREIKFRGKKIDNGEWIYGNLINWNPSLNPRIIWFEEDLKEINFEVLPETVGQYIGLKDKNGTDIYEDDILNVDYHGYISKRIVIFDNGAFKKVFKEDDLEVFKDIFTPRSYKNTEVIGNIHE